MIASVTIIPRYGFRCWSVGEWYQRRRRYSVADKKHVRILKRGVEAWNKWRKEYPEVVPDLGAAILTRRGVLKPSLEGVNFKGANLEKVSLAGVNLEKANLEGANLQEADLRKVRPRMANLGGADLRKADLQGANLEKAILRRANLREAVLRESNLRVADLGMANLGKANLAGVDLWKASMHKANLGKANLQGASLVDANLAGANLAGADLREASLQGANLREAYLAGASLVDVNLLGTDLTGANLAGADLSGADLVSVSLTEAFFSGARIRHTSLRNIQFNTGHPSLNDGSDTVVFHWRDKYLNWAWLRAIGRFPLFGVSWAALAASLVTINTIGFLNHHQWLQWIKYPIPIPERMMLILFDCLLLVAGTTLYKLACPARIQEFTETRWVEELKHARLHYIAEKLRRPWLQWPTLLLNTVGAGLALFLIGERIWWAFRYIFEELGLAGG
jgi:uncharacterized protein YjbI with pentapeptide repeats